MVEGRNYAVVGSGPDAWGVRAVRRGLLVSMVLCLAAAGASACGSSGSESSADRALVWSDEFDGANGALPDPAKWKLEQFADATDDEKQCYTDSSANVHTDGNGYLVISANKESGNCADGWYRDITSARLTTQGLGSWEHARFEIRAKMPTGVGTWPAFWAMGDDPDIEWPEVGEIDGMEYVGRNRSHVIGTVHGADDDGDHWFLQADTDSQTLLSADMHTYAVEWDGDTVSWFLDSKEYGTVTRDEVEAEGDWAFDRPFYLILNLAIGGVLGGEVPTSLTFPQELVVDWVRVYA
jgi:beta-glucanase (GH16 family)